MGAGQQDLCDFVHEAERGGTIYLTHLRRCLELGTMEADNYVPIVKSVVLLAFALFAVSAVLGEIWNGNVVEGTYVKLMRVALRIGLAGLGSLIALLVVEAHAYLRARRRDSP